MAICVTICVAVGVAVGVAICKLTTQPSVL